ncbi:MAG: pyruvate formate lyase-activating protein [Akkermansia sp.]|nr:pyruvate formate lyase-activating protein [Akkermansia sp.]
MLRFGGTHMTSPAMTGLVHSVESCGTVDGPGIRFVVFLSGCSLRCRYCHNPDTSYKRQGKERSVEDMLAEIARYATFVKNAGGGVTLSGGDPLFQPAYTRALLRGCKELGLHTCIDTSGHLGSNADDAMLADVDLVLLDIKAWQPECYRALTSQPLQPTLDFAARLAAMGKPIWLRYVLVPGVNDRAEDIEPLAQYAASLGNVERVDVLPLHHMGRFKWQELGLDYTLADTEPPTPEQTAEAKAIFRAAGLQVH